MLRLPKIIRKTLSVRISLMVVSAITILLMVSLVVMFHYSRKAVKEEAIQMAQQTLDGMVLTIDNILLSVEQTTGNIYFNLLPHLDKPDLYYVYTRKLVESNPYVTGCAIAMKEDYFPGRQYFMAYYHRSKTDSTAYSDEPILQSETFDHSHYSEQLWFTEPMKSGKVGWMMPLADNNSVDDPVITFCLPILGSDGKPVGVLGVDISLSLLSRIMSVSKPSPNSYSTLLDRDGSYIVHPFANKLMKETALVHSEESAKKAAQAMVSGGSGYMPFNINGTDLYVFYKPFKRMAVSGRVTNDLGWSAGIVYPKDDIFGDYIRLSYYAIAIAVCGLLLLYVLCRTMIHVQLKPLLMLGDKVQRIAQGNYDEPIPPTWRKDEVGRLQANFQQMQQSLSANISELEQLKNDLQERGDHLRQAYTQAEKADRIKTTFLHNMTNQMIPLSDAINQDVSELCNANGSNKTTDTSQLVNDIQQKGNTIAELLKDLLNMSDEEVRKEGADV